MPAVVLPFVGAVVSSSMEPRAGEAVVSRTGAVLPSVTVKLKVELEGVEVASFPSSTLMEKEAELVCELLCWKETCPAVS